MAIWQKFLSLAAGIASPLVWPSRTYVIPPHPETGVSEFIRNHAEGPWDGPKLSKVNSSAIEWWYFDACSKEGDQGIGAWFFTANPQLFGFDLPTSNWVLFHARFNDSTGIDTTLTADELVIQTIGEGSSAVYPGVGSWAGTPDLSSYTVAFDDPRLDMSGNIIITSRSEGHTTTQPVTDPNADFMTVGNLGWAVSIPDGAANAHVQIGKKVISFNDGVGYHDHNWGANMGGFKNWYAIHATVGPFVWAGVEALYDDDSGTFGSSHITENGSPILMSLDPKHLKIRPWGNGAEYPPTGFHPQPLGAIVEFDAGVNGTFRFNVTNKTNSPGVNIGKGLAKWFGSATGGRVDGPQYTGIAMFEWLDLLI